MYLYLVEGTEPSGHKKTPQFPEGFSSSGNWTRTSDLRVMSHTNTGFIWSHIYSYN